MHRVALTLTALALAACSSTPPQTAPTPAPAAAAAAPAPAAAKVAALNPVGSFEFNTEINGSPMKGMLKVTGTPGAYGGSMSSDVTPELPITSVTVDGQSMRLAVDTPNGPATINVAFKGDAFAGNWELGGASGSVTGKRIK